jgi:hypothetical protein
MKCGFNNDDDDGGNAKNQLDNKVLFRFCIIIVLPCLERDFLVGSGRKKTANLLAKSEWKQWL